MCFFAMNETEGLGDQVSSPPPPPPLSSTKQEGCYWSQEISLQNVQNNISQLQNLRRTKALYEPVFYSRNHVNLKRSGFLTGKFEILSQLTV